MLGATGSVGRSTLALVRADPAAYRVTALVAGSRAAPLAALAREFDARLAVVADPAAYPGPQYGASYPPPPQQYGAPGGYGYPAAPPGTNTMAIASLVASVVGVLCGIGSVVGIVLGVVALNQIKQTRQAGYGLAVAGIVVGIATLIISMIWAIYAWR